MLKPNNPGDKVLSNIKCECGRKIRVKRSGYDKREFLCSTCKTYGVDKSRLMFLQINAESDKTIFSDNQKQGEKAI